MKSSFSVQDTFAVKGIAILMMYIHHNFLSPARWGKCFVDFWPLTEKLTVIYSFKYAWLDTLVLLVITLLLSIIIEKIKDVSGYNRMVNRKLFS